MKKYLSDYILDNYECHDFRHALCILRNDYPTEFNELINTLTNFKLRKSSILKPGGRKSPISEFIDSNLYQFGWIEKNFDTKFSIDGVELETPTHKIDCYKNRIALDIEWNNKDPFFDRDLNNYRLLHERNAISIGVIITRCDELQSIFNSLNKGSSYGASTTQMKKLLPRIYGGAGGGCPILVFGIKPKLYDPNS